jgi:membrane-bound lytic murein transglycosylase MltF
MIKKILLYFFIFIIFLSSIYTNINLINENSIVKKENTYLKVEKDVYSKTLKINLNSNNEIDIEYTNPKYNDFVHMLNDFKNIYFLISVSEVYGYDWKLFAVQIFYESTFNTNAISPTGAKGLMQLTRFVYHNDADPFNEIHNLFVGISYFDYLYNKFSYIENEKERIKFVLAAYHDGHGKIEIQRKNLIIENINPNKYSNIKNYLSLECQKYVNNILTTYNDISI